MKSNEPWMPVGRLMGHSSHPSRGRRVAPFFKTKKLAIVGCTQSVIYTPWADPTWTIVAHSSARYVVEREPDYWIDLHPRSCFSKAKNWHKSYFQWLQETSTPVFMQEEWPDIPAAVRYPKERILSEFRAFFTNQVAWMIALAMTEGVTHIGLFGCQYKADTEYGIQRESCVYWMGRFEGAGGTIILPPKWNSLLCRPAELYGYESHDEVTGALIPSYRAASVPGVNTTEPKPLKQGDALQHREIGFDVAWDRAKSYGITRDGYVPELVGA